ncbi:unnamed protein product [Ambrosiozyma monospora]|uniref:Unnamed protein product n=1 Tax=Ambrosiozyma monospora TaxID=43982 RepID=A0ACB5TCY3_AMBMO|nr:unnamed protein product [Ambrosiozyma monospora]
MKESFHYYIQEEGQRHRLIEIPLVQLMNAIRGKTFIEYPAIYVSLDAEFEKYEVVKFGEENESDSSSSDESDSDSDSSSDDSDSSDDDSDSDDDDDDGPPEESSSKPEAAQEIPGLESSASVEVSKAVSEADEKEESEDDYDPSELFKS